MVGCGHWEEEGVVADSKTFGSGSWKTELPCTGMGVLWVELGLLGRFRLGRF